MFGPSAHLVPAASVAAKILDKPVNVFLTMPAVPVISLVLRAGYRCRAHHKRGQRNVGRQIRCAGLWITPIHAIVSVLLACLSAKKSETPCPAEICTLLEFDLLEGARKQFRTTFGTQYCSKPTAK